MKNSFKFQVNEDELLSELDELVGKQESTAKKTQIEDQVPTLPQVPADELPSPLPEAGLGDLQPVPGVRQTKKNSPSEKQMVEA